MPIVAWGAAALMTGIGVKLFGDGVEDSGRAVRDVIIAGAVGYGVYMVAKKQGVI